MSAAAWMPALRAATTAALVVALAAAPPPNGRPTPAPRPHFGEPRSIVWVDLNGDKECHNGSDAGILELRVARFVGRTHQFIFVGNQVQEADLAFRIYDCSGREILHYPLDESSPYGEGRFAPYFLSLTGSASVVALAR